jgi:hypothetical protein
MLAETEEIFHAPLLNPDNLAQSMLEASLSKNNENKAS